MSTKRTVANTLSFLGAAIREGQHRLGVERGPEIMRRSGLFNMLHNSFDVTVHDHGDIKATPEDYTLHPPVIHPARNLNVLGPLLGRLHQKAYEIIQNKDNGLLLTTGGDHSIAIGTISAVQRAYQDLKVIWVDAHPDFNPVDRNSDQVHVNNVHGAPVSILTQSSRIPNLNYWSWFNSLTPLNPKNIVLIAIREIDPFEYELLPKSGIKCYTMDHVEKYGISEVMRQAIDHLDPHD